MVLKNLLLPCLGLLNVLPWADLLSVRLRRKRLYCVGLGKSGTHSIAAMFAKPVRAGHESGASTLIERILRWKEGEISEDDFADWLLERDHELGLHVDSSNLNGEIASILLRLFPDARFILTIRDCYSWSNSMIKHSIRLREKTHPLWLKIRDMRFQPEKFPHTAGESLLRDSGCFSLESYFACWARHNETMIATIPADRLFIVRTDQITANAAKIADFSGFSRKSLRLDRTHEYKNPEKRAIIRELDPALVEQAAQRHCRPLMQRFFPEIQSLTVAKL
jgi:hypothetical protein